MSNYLHTHYNLNDPKVVSIIDETSLWSAPPGMAILNRMPYRGGMNVLDIGFGPGFPLCEIAMRLGTTSTVYGIDPWKEGVKRTKKKLSVCEISNVKIVEGVAEKMPFENNFFDLIVSNNGLNNVEDYAENYQWSSRVSKIGGRFIFTFNTDQTFNEFYSVYRDVLKENGLQKYNQKISDHINHKRKPVSEFTGFLDEFGFKVIVIDQDKYYYRFMDGTAMLNHFFIKLAFLDSWKNLLPENLHAKIFTEIEDRLNRQSTASGGFSMNVPFVMIDCEKVK